MRIEITTQGDVTIVKPHPRPSGLISAEGADGLESRLRELVQNGKKKILIDLGATEFLLSRPIGSLVGVQAHAFRNGAALYLCDVDKRIHNVLVVMWLVRTLNVLGTRKEALKFLENLDVQLAPEKFEFHAAAVADCTARLSYLWKNDGTTVTVNQSSAPTSGKAMVHIVDAAGEEVFAHSVLDRGGWSGMIGKAGNWRIDLDLLEYSGTVDFTIHQA